MTATRVDAVEPAGRGAAPFWLSAPIGRMAAALGRMLRRRAARRALARMDDRLLDDIGLRRAQIEDALAGRFRDERL
jgi:uncharacterized protein YjiS (DUF1127 family)